LSLANTNAIVACVCVDDKPHTGSVGASDTDPTYARFADVEDHAALAPAVYAGVDVLLGDGAPM
jgi:hypothetical protein